MTIPGEVARNGGRLSRSRLSARRPAAARFDLEHAAPPREADGGAAHAAEEAGGVGIDLVRAAVDGAGDDDGPAALSFQHEAETEDDGIDPFGRLLRLLRAVERATEDGEGEAGGSEDRHSLFA